MIPWNQFRGQSDTAAGAEIGGAERAANEADQLVVALEERVRAGDPGVTVAELGEARRVADFARLQLHAAHGRAAEIQAEARRRFYAELGEEVRALDLDNTTMVAAFDEALAGLRKLYSLAEERSARVVDLSRNAEAVIDEAKVHDELSLVRTAGVYAAGTIDGFRRGLILTPVDGQPNYLGAIAGWQATAAVLGRVLDEAREPGVYPPWTGHDFEAVINAQRPVAAEFPATAVGAAR